MSSFGGAGYQLLVIHPYPVEPTPGDSTHFYGCESPAGWSCPYLETDPYVSFVPDDFEWLGEHVSGFSFVSNRAAPCVHMIFGTPVIGSEYGIATCLRCDAPVPSRPTSWGRVKSAYR